MHLKPPLNLDANYKLMLDKVNAKLEERYALITEALSNDDVEKALGAIWHTALLEYMVNQNYTGDFLETALLYLNARLSQNQATHFEHKKNTVLYYDRPALDNGSLTPIFLDALGAIGLHIVYVTTDNKFDEIPKIKAVLKKYNAEIKTFTNAESFVNSYQSLCETILDIRPEYMVFYPYPQDVVGYLAFMRFKGSCKRYLMDITDHAFWLGRNAFDYFAVGRDTQASICVLYRGIPESKLAEYHYAPVIPKPQEFQGFPFEKKENDFVIFSGGANYKTEDEKMTFYNIVFSIMAAHENVKFWYAMENKSVGMQKLMQVFPDRVFNTPTRADLFAVLQNVDLFLNTYPMYGGSMMVFAAAAALPPFTLKFGDEVSGLLKDQDNLGIMFDTQQEICNAIHRYILDPKYRDELKQNMKHALYTREEMIESFKQMIYDPKPAHFNIKEPDISNFRSWYFKSRLYTVEYFLGGL